MTRTVRFEPGGMCGRCGVRIPALCEAAYPTGRPCSSAMSTDSIAGNLLIAVLLPGIPRGWGGFAGVTHVAIADATMFHAVTGLGKVRE